jgi:hypothetical protein
LQIVAPSLVGAVALVEALKAWDRVMLDPPLLFRKRENTA